MHAHRKVSNHRNPLRSICSRSWAIISDEKSMASTLAPARAADRERAPGPHATSAMSWPGPTCAKRRASSAYFARWGAISREYPSATRSQSRGAVSAPGDCDIGKAYRNPWPRGTKIAPLERGFSPCQQGHSGHREHGTHDFADADLFPECERGYGDQQQGNKRHQGTGRARG